MTDAEVFDFLDENVSDFDNTVPLHLFDFYNEDAAEVPTDTKTDAEEEYIESQKVIKDVNGNVYDLEFVKAPIGESYDDYIKDEINRKSYDEVTTQDEYWDGQDTHSYVKNKHLSEDFTIVGTKYMSLNYKVSMKEYMYQMNYFLTMIYSSTTDLSGINFIMPTINSTSAFNITDIFVLLYALSGLYQNKTQYVEVPQNIHTGNKPDFSAYDNEDGGHPWNGTDPVPDVPVTPDTPWVMDDEYDFGCDDTEDIDSSTATEANTYDFGYQNTIDPTADLHDFDFGNEDNSTATTTTTATEAVTTEETTTVSKYPWDDLEKGYYSDDFNGNTPKDALLRRPLDGSDIIEDITKESFFDWLRTNHPELFTPVTARVYGFNLKANLTEIAKNISIRHSDFGFEKGYTLADFGIDSFMTADSITNIDDFIKIYETNTTCYNNLLSYLKVPNNRDQDVIVRYLYTNLFTKPFDYNFYRLKSGEIATTYDQLLKEKNYTLYKFYQSILTEQDITTRTDNIRAILNDLIETLQYYIKADNIGYIYEFIPTHSFTAINTYINLMINFFKSWKVYFLSPEVTYVADDMSDNRGGAGNSDQMVEYKSKFWLSDSAINADNCTIKMSFDINDKGFSALGEVIDMYAHHIDYVDDDHYDGAYANTDAAVYTVDLDGGHSSKASCVPFIMVDCGNIAARKVMDDMDGGGAITKEFYLSADGLKVTDYYSTHPIDNNFTVPNISIDGGSASYGEGTNTRSSNSITTKINGYEVTNDLKISSYDSNNLVVSNDGLYLEDTLVDSDDFEALKNTMETERASYISNLSEYAKAMSVFEDPDYATKLVKADYDKVFANANAVIDDMTYNTTKNYVNSYVNTSVAELRNWFDELDPFKWQYF
jgi:hypothetical protein